LLTLRRSKRPDGAAEPSGGFFFPLLAKCELVLYTRSCSCQCRVLSLLSNQLMLTSGLAKGKKRKADETQGESPSNDDKRAKRCRLIVCACGRLSHFANPLLHVECLAHTILSGKRKDPHLRQASLTRRLLPGRARPRRATRT
jgi:hypothetical protein